MPGVHRPGGVKRGYGWLTGCTSKVVDVCTAVMWCKQNGCSILAACASSVSGVGVLLKRLMWQVGASVIRLVNVHERTNIRSSTCTYYAGSRE